MHNDIEIINSSVFKPCGFELSNLKIELESQEYFAHNFQLDNLNVKFRVAKTTPTKSGLFVTIWKRNENGITVPFEISDEIDFFIIATRQNENFGIFVFPKIVLYEKRILADKLKDGKRGIRVYPSWSLTTSHQAQKTRHWQSKYFLDLSKNGHVDLTFAKKLLLANK